MPTPFSSRGLIPSRPLPASRGRRAAVLPAPATPPTSTSTTHPPPPPFAWADDWHPPTRPRPRLALVDLRHALVPYESARSAQHALVAAVRASREDGPAPPDLLSSGAVLLLQHRPVFTLGAGATTAHLRFDPDDPAAWPAPLTRVERGGEVTYHGPGQLVLYPILDLSGAFLPDLHWYMRALEQVVIEALALAADLPAGRLPGLTGVWCPPPPETGDAASSSSSSKLAAVGVRAAGWVSYHGVALNVTCDLAPFSAIVPCGIGDRPVGSVAGMLEEAQRRGGEGGEGGDGATTTTPTTTTPDPFLLDECAEALLASTARVLAADFVTPAAAGGRIGEAAAAVEAELRRAAGGD